MENIVCEVISTVPIRYLESIELTKYYTNEIGRIVVQSLKSDGRFPPACMPT